MNRPLHDSKGEVYDIIAGKFFIAGSGEEDFCDLPDSLMRKYEEEFHQPKQFKKVAGRVLIMNQKEESSLSGYQGDKEIRLSEANHLAFEVDTFLRQNSQAYDEMYSDPHAEREQIAQDLLDGKTWKVRMCMTTVVQEEYLEEEAEPLHKMISDYEKNTGLIPIPSISLIFPTAQINTVLCLLAGFRRRGFRSNGKIIRWSTQRSLHLEIRYIRSLKS